MVRALRCMRFLFQASKPRGSSVTCFPKSVQYERVERYQRGNASSTSIKISHLVKQRSLMPAESALSPPRSQLDVLDHLRTCPRDRKTCDLTIIDGRKWSYWKSFVYYSGSYLISFQRQAGRQASHFLKLLVVEKGGVSHLFLKIPDGIVLFFSDIHVYIVVVLQWESCLHSRC